MLKSCKSILSSRAAQTWTFALLCLLLAAGCKKSSDQSTPAPSSPSLPDTHPSSLSRLHWLGKKRLVTETNAAAFMQIWNLPESARLEAQTLDKLSTAPWRLLKGMTNGASSTNAQTPVGASTLLRPLLEDLVQEESFLEIHGVTNHPAELALAIKLNEIRAELWRTNLAAVLESLTGAKSVPVKDRHGFQLPLTINHQLSTIHY